MPSRKRLFEVQVWDYHMKVKFRSFWTQVVEKPDEAAMRRTAYVKARWQAYQQGVGEYFEMESFKIQVVDAKDRAVKRDAPKNKRERQVSRDFPNYGTCPRCGEDTTDEKDYCAQCGWSKHASTWYGDVSEKDARAVGCE